MGWTINMALCGSPQWHVKAISDDLRAQAHVEKVHSGNLASNHSGIYKHTLNQAEI